MDSFSLTASIQVTIMGPEYAQTDKELETLLCMHP